jgi:hypothetical protein
MLIVMVKFGYNWDKADWKLGVDIGRYLMHERLRGDRD